MTAWSPRTRLGQINRFPGGARKSRKLLLAGLSIRVPHVSPVTKSVDTSVAVTLYSARQPHLCIAAPGVFTATLVTAVLSTEGTQAVASVGAS
jgi:hypothetical protein